MAPIPMGTLQPRGGPRRSASVTGSTMQPAGAVADTSTTQAAPGQQFDAEAYRKRIEEQQRQQQQAELAAETAAANQPQQAGPTGFISFGQQLAANQQAAQQMAGRIQSEVKSAQDVTALGTQEGRQALLKRALGKAATVSDLDAALAGAGSGGEFERLSSSYGEEAQMRRARELERQRAQQAADRAADQRFRAMTADVDRMEKQKRDAAAREQGIRDEIARLQLDSDLQMQETGSIRSAGRYNPEVWASMHGMTLEQWVRNGKQPPLP